jgi:signal transduction histidine kinase
MDRVRKSNILLVDDHPENLLTLEAVLEELGQNLVKAGSGREALRHLLDAEFAVVLLDVHMPDLDGFQTASLIRSRPKSRHTPLIFLTATSKSASHVFQGYSIGAVDYVFKPFAPEVLRSKVAAFVELSRKREELQSEIDQRKEAEAEIRRLNRELEYRVSRRTAELAATNRRLEAEISERKQLETVLQQRAGELAEAGRRKDEFLAMLAHELRNPLAPIQNAVEIQRVCDPLDPRFLRQREVIERQIHHLSRLVDDLLDVSRITRGNIELRKEPLDLEAALRQSVEAAGPLIEERGHTLHLSLPSAPLHLQADPARLQQILVNLLHNAAKYMETGGTIWLSGEQEDTWAVLRVRDAGDGIAPDLLPHIFELFTQADRSLDRSQGGLGIGLTMVHRLAQLHEGRVEARSEGLGHGSEFVVRLPVTARPAGPHAAGDGARDAEPVSAGASLPALTPGPWRPASRAKRVLVVDDNADAAKTLADVLEIWGCEVCVAHDGVSAIDTARTYTPHIVLLDIGLPGMDGYEVARRLREQENFGDTLLIAVTGYGQEEDRRQSHEARLDHHLTKPVDPEKLRRLLAEVSTDRPLLC